MMPFCLLALGLFFVFSATAQNNVVTKGSVQLIPGQRYRITFRIPTTAFADSTEQQVLGSFAANGAIDAKVVARGNGDLVVSAVSTSPAPLTLTIGQSVLGVGQLLSVERLP